MATNLRRKIGVLADESSLSHRHSETDWNIATAMDSVEAH